MGDQGVAGLVRTPEIPEFHAGDPFFERAQEINDLITRRAYELFEARALTHGRDREDWLRAESEILLRAPVDVSETEDQFTVRMDVAGFADKDIEVRVASRSLCITAKRQEAWERREVKIIHSERRASEIFRVLELPLQVDPDRVNARLTDGVLEVTLAKVGLEEKVIALTKAAAA